MPAPVPPPKRSYKARTYRKAETSLQDRYVTVGVAVVGFFFGGLAGVRWQIGFLPGALAGMVIAVAAAKSLIWLAVRLVAGPLAPSGKSVAYQTDYSAAQALVAQGKYAEAAEAYEVAALESDGDPEPYFQVARIYRDHLQQYEAALAWFQRARTDARLTSGQELVALQETVALYTGKLGTPRKALPELVTITERFPGTPAAEAATRELATMRAMLAREREGAGPFTDQYRKDRERESPGG